MAKRYCRKCNKATEHAEVRRLAFLEQCAIALATSFASDLRQHDLECNECGTKRDR